MASGKLLRTLSKHISRVEAVAYSPDGHTLASDSDDETVILWLLAGDDILCQFMPGNTPAKPKPTVRKELANKQRNLPASSSPKASN